MEPTAGLRTMVAKRKIPQPVGNQTGVLQLLVRHYRLSYLVPAASNLDPN